jgi:hypothetical protein
MADFYWLVLGVLATWRVTHLLNREDGPWDLMVRFRRFVGNGLGGQLLDCFACASVWIAAPAAWLLGAGWKQRLFLWLALSAGAVLIERLTRREDAAVYYEDPEARHGVLRQPKTTTRPDPPGPFAS